MKKDYWKGRIVVREATTEDALQVADNLRKADQKELWSAFRLRPKDGCLKSLERSERVFVIDLEGKAIAIFGVTTLSLIDRRGIIWLLGTDEIFNIAVTFEKYTKAFVESFLMEWDVLENWVHAKNRISLKWLRRAGFNIGDPVPYGLDKELFRKIEIRKDGIGCVEQRLQSE